MGTEAAICIVIGLARLACWFVEARRLMPSFLVIARTHTLRACWAHWVGESRILVPSFLVVSGNNYDGCIIRLHMPITERRLIGTGDY
jgi:hypothetical protein